MADRQHNTGVGAENHTTKSLADVADEAARAALGATLVAADGGRVVQQTAGVTPGWYMYDGAGGWLAIGAGSGGVTSFEGRTGAVTAQPGDYTAADVGAEAAGAVATHAALSNPHGTDAADVGADPSGTAAAAVAAHAAVASAHDAVDVDYDNGSSGLAATDVQGAIDEVAAAVGSGLDIDSLPAATPAGGDLVVVSQGGAESQATVTDLLATAGLVAPAPPTWADYWWDSADAAWNGSDQLTSWPDADTTSPISVGVGTITPTPPIAVPGAFAYPADGGNFAPPKTSLAFGSDRASGTFVTPIPATSDLYLAIHSRWFCSVVGNLLHCGVINLACTVANTTVSLQWQQASTTWRQITLAVENIPGFNGGPGLIELEYDADDHIYLWFNGQLLVGTDDTTQLGTLNSAYSGVTLGQATISPPGIGAGFGRFNIDGLYVSGTLPTAAQRRQAAAYYGVR